MKRLPIAQIRRDGGTQPRRSIDDETVASYAEALRDGADFPPVIVFYDGTDYWLADGFHRVDAHEACGIDRIAADVQQGTQRDAILYSVGANATHGKPRSNADKRRAILRLLSDDEWGVKSDRWVAKACRVSDKTVASARSELRNSAVDEKRVGHDGKVRKLPKKRPDRSEAEPHREPLPDPEVTNEPASAPRPSFFVPDDEPGSFDDDPPVDSDSDDLADAEEDLAVTTLRGRADDVLRDFYKRFPHRMEDMISMIRKWLSLYEQKASEYEQRSHSSWS